MMTLADSLRTLWWLVHKDLLREIRAPRAWPAMLLLGVVLLLTIQMQVAIAPERASQQMAGLFWVAALFAGTLNMDRSLSGERDEGCWQSLLLYPTSPGTIFLAKVIANFLALTSLIAVLITASSVFSDATIFVRPGPLLAIILAANLGLAAVGTLTSTIVNSLAHRSSLLILLMLPLVSPVVIGAAQATQLLLVSANNEWLRWLQLLICFSVVYVTLGTLLFEFVIEE